MHQTHAIYTGWDTNISSWIWHHILHQQKYPVFFPWNNLIWFCRHRLKTKHCPFVSLARDDPNIDFQYQPYVIHVYVLLNTSPSSMYKPWGGGVPTLESDQSGPRLWRKCLHHFSIPTSHLFQPCSGLFFPLPTGLSTIAPQYFTRWQRFYLSLYPLPFPPPFLVTERPYTWTSPPPAGLHHSPALTLPSGGPKGVPHVILCLTSPYGCPPLPS